MKILFNRLNHLQICIPKGEEKKEDTPIPGYKRFSLYDFWNNRIELMEKVE